MFVDQTYKTQNAYFFKLLFLDLHFTRIFTKIDVHKI